VLLRSTSGIVSVFGGSCFGFGFLLFFGLIVGTAASTLSPVASVHAPEIFRSFSTRSVGWAPCWSQWTARSLSILMTDGS
jgi:hypothetical protein